MTKKDTKKTESNEPIVAQMEAHVTSTSNVAVGPESEEDKSLKHAIFKAVAEHLHLEFEHPGALQNHLDGNAVSENDKINVAQISKAVCAVVVPYCAAFGG